VGLKYLAVSDVKMRVGQYINGGLTNMVKETQKDRDARCFPSEPRREIRPEIPVSRSTEKSIRGTNVDVSDKYTKVGKALK
jgi:hypothetical protein